MRVVKTPVYDSEQRAVGVQGIFWEVPGKSQAVPAKKKASKAAKPKPAKKPAKKKKK